MADPLPEDQAFEVREIAEQEVSRFARILADEVAAVPMRADGNLNGRDVWRALNESVKRYVGGDSA